ncbi:ACT domain-containing protein [Clostridia bacterium]|nr:ACT domain-containing protein [Clostridia bacterium]
MKIVQISVFIENKPGRLSAVSSILAENNINIRALSIADTSDFGILRLIVDKPEEAYAKLKENGLTASITNVLSVRMPDKPGGLSNVLKVLNENDINVEYMYAFVSKASDDALVVFKVENIEDAEVKLQSTDIKVLSRDEVYGL